MADIKTSMDQADADDAPAIDPREAAGLRLLRRLVTALTVLFVLGFLVMIVAFVTRFPDPPAAASTLTLPDHIALPESVVAEAFTHGGEWLAVVADNKIYIFVTSTGALHQVLQIDAVTQ